MIVQRILAGFFLLLMAATLAVQSVHRHHSKAALQGRNHQDHFADYHPHCLSCDHFHYRTGFIVPVLSAVQLTRLLPVPIRHDGRYVPELYAIALPHAANRGPPPSVPSV
ncbi:hypothetical protein [Niabella beijingensis]|uniref:hypothetical protein n=1 Tax=Niabella beijingensis TaxID=2872700 RepID=UPI001CC12A6F|nr:hypothetical protein [Niabella beijingensis]MBZ4192471.1 hypothetical protein [Niabella beijingensis]